MWEMERAIEILIILKKYEFLMNFWSVLPN